MRRCGRRSSATRCSPLPPTSSTRRRPWPSTPRPRSPASCVEGVEILGAALPDNPPQRSAWLTATEISTGGATMLRNLGFRPLVFTPEIYNGLEGSIGGFVDTTLAVEVDLGDGTRFPAMVLHATGAAARTCGGDRRHQRHRRRRADHGHAGHDAARARRRPAPQRRARRARLRHPGPRRRRDAGDVRRRDARLRAGAAVGPGERHRHDDRRRRRPAGRHAPRDGRTRPHRAGPAHRPDPHLGRELGVDDARRRPAARVARRPGHPAVDRRLRRRGRRHAGAHLGRSRRRAGPSGGPPAVHVHPHRPLEPAAPEPAQHGRPSRCASSSVPARRSSRSRTATSSSSWRPTA